MNWQEQARQAYQQRQAEKEQAKQQVAEQQRNLLKAQFEAQARIAAQQLAERERQADEQRNRERQQQTAALQRIADDLRIANEQREARQREAQERLKQLEMQQQKVWIGWDGREFRSPMERDFWNAWMENGKQDTTPLVPQFAIGKYRVDFAHPGTLTAIEIDGYKFHSSRHAFTNDRLRERFLEKQGWHVVRFSATEIAYNVTERIDEVYEIIVGRNIP